MTLYGCLQHILIDKYCPKLSFISQPVEQQHAAVCTAVVAKDADAASMKEPEFCCSSTIHRSSDTFKCGSSS